MEGLPPFTGGLVGYFAYDFIGYSEPTVKLPVDDSEHFKNADLMLFDPNETWTVDPDKLHGKSKNSPFKGLTLTSKVKLTVCGGKIVFNEI